MRLKTAELVRVHYDIFLKKEEVSLTFYGYVVVYHKYIHTGLTLVGRKIEFSSYMVKYFRISSYIRQPFLIYDSATVSI
jgi:hypothetical protein